MHRNYIKFILYDLLQSPRFDFLRNTKLLDIGKELNEIDFDPVDETDSILTGKGIDCRRLYFQQFGKWPQEGGCSMLEMLAGLALSCDEMLSPDPGNTTGFDFFNFFIDNLYSMGNIEESCAHYRIHILMTRDPRFWNLDLWSQCNQFDWSSI